MPEICLLSHFYKLCQKSVCYHISIKHLLHTLKKKVYSDTLLLRISMEKEKCRRGLNFIM